MACILLIQPDLPENTYGGRKRVYHLMQALMSAGHEIHLLVSLHEEDLPLLEPLETMGARCHPVFFQAQRLQRSKEGPVREVGRKIGESLRFRHASLRAISDPLPRCVKAHWIAPLRRGLHELLQLQSFDLVVVENEENARLAHHIPHSVPLLLDAQNVLSSMAARDVALQSWRDLFDLHRLSERAQPSKLRRFEQEMLQRYDAVIVMSELEAQRLRQLAPEFAQRVHVIENGVDVQSYTSRCPTPTGDKLIFTGLMSYGPNIDAMLWFVREVWPLIVRTRPATRLDIVGAYPVPEVRALGADVRIHVTGRVERVQPYLEEASVVIVPLRMGGGTRLKILEAAAMRRPVVSTHVGAEGLDCLRDGDHLLLRDTPQDFADGVIALLHNRDRSRQIADAAHEVVAVRYDWSGIGRKFECLSAQLAKSRRAEGDESVWQK